MVRAESSVISVLWVMPLLSFFWACTDYDINKTATIILSEDESKESLPIVKSPDGLQFTQNNIDSDVEASVGFSNKGHLSYKGEFKNDKPHGLWTTFFPDGKPRWQGYKKEGINHGRYTLWYDNGRKRMEGTYENGKKQGLSTSWHPNGAKWQHQLHVAGQPKGTWKTWDPKGNLISQIFHKQNADQNVSLGIPN